MPADTIPLALAAERAGIGRATAYRLERDGQLPFRSLRIGRRIVVPTVSFETWLYGDSESGEA